MWYIILGRCMSRMLSRTSHNKAWGAGKAGRSSPSVLFYANHLKERVHFLFCILFLYKIQSGHFDHLAQICNSRLGWTAKNFTQTNKVYAHVPLMHRNNPRTSSTRRLVAVRFSSWVRGDQFRTSHWGMNLQLTPLTLENKSHKSHCNISQNLMNPWRDIGTHGLQSTH